jgi:[acyl-carrier-protein] S-malonyltransferase
MAAVIGLSAADVEAICEEAAQGEVVSPANFNGGGQIVIAGHTAAVGRACALVQSRNARALPLQVSAPFHCALMQPAADRLAAALAGIEIGSFTAPVITNVQAEPNDDPARVVDLLVAQVTQRVRWEASVQRAVAMGAAQALELGHGKRLAGMLRRIKPKLSVLAVGSPGDVDVLKGGSYGAK